MDIASIIIIGLFVASAIAVIRGIAAMPAAWREIESEDQAVGDRKIIEAAFPTYGMDDGDATVDFAPDKTQPISGTSGPRTYHLQYGQKIECTGDENCPLCPEEVTCLSLPHIRETP